MGKDKNLIEGTLGLDRLAKGGMVTAWYSEYNSCWDTNGNVRTRSHDRLIIGTDAQRSYVRLEVMRFARDMTREFKEPYKCSHTSPENRDLHEHPDGFEYVGDEDMHRFCGIRFTTTTMRNIISEINQMIGSKATPALTKEVECE
jgi:hypothetical protein